MINKIAISVLTAACIGVPAYGYQWTVAIDDTVQANEAAIQAAREAQKVESQRQKEYRDDQKDYRLEQRSRMMRIEDLLMEMNR